MNITPLPIERRAPTLIFLNGPAGVGKSTLSDALVERADRGEVTQYHHASALWAMMDCLVFDNSNPDEPFLNYSDPEVKSRPVAWHGPLPREIPTYRQALISLGQWARDTFGPQVLSRLAVEAAREYLNSGFATVVFPACRTPEDIEPLVAAAGSANCLLVRLFREGHSFASDLGSYLPENTCGVRTIDLHNDGTVEDLLDAFDDLLELRV